MMGAPLAPSDEGYAHGIYETGWSCETLLNGAADVLCGGFHASEKQILSGAIIARPTFLLHSKNILYSSGSLPAGAIAIIWLVCLVFN